MEGGFRWDMDVVSYFTLSKQAITDRKCLLRRHSTQRHDRPT